MSLTAAVLSLGILLHPSALTGLQPSVQASLAAATRQLQAAHVGHRLTSAWRSRREQARLWIASRRGRSRYPAARPGASAHERGLAVDLIFTGRESLGRAIMHRHGFVQNVPGDRPHWLWQGR